MSNGISALHSEFTAALTEVLAENAVGPARRGRLARARAAVSHDLKTMNKRLRALEAKSAQEGLVAIHSRIPGLHATSTNYYIEPVWNRNFRLVRVDGYEKCRQLRRGDAETLLVTLEPPPK